MGSAIGTLGGTTEVLAILGKRNPSSSSKSKPDLTLQQLQQVLFEELILYTNRLSSLLAFLGASIKGSSGLHAQFISRNIDAITIRPRFLSSNSCQRHDDVFTDNITTKGEELKEQGDSESKDTSAFIATDGEDRLAVPTKGRCCLNWNISKGDMLQRYNNDHKEDHGVSHNHEKRTNTKTIPRFGIDKMVEILQRFVYISSNLEGMQQYIGYILFSIVKYTMVQYIYFC